MKTKVIIDCDTGVDDAVALVYAISDPSLEVKLITTTYGNVELEQSSSNTLHLLEKFHKRIPVAIGAEKPLVKDAAFAKDIHQNTGMGLYIPEMPKTSAIKADAVSAIYKTINNNKNEIVFISLGPSTNLATLILKHPSVKCKIKEIVIMGGSYKGEGNIKPYAEFNVFNDPDALKIILNSGIKTSIVPMEVGLNSRMNDEMLNKIRNINEVGAFIAKMFDGYVENDVNLKGVQLHDISALFYVLNPKIFKSGSAEVEVSIKNEDRGRTIVNFCKNGNVNVVIEVDNQKFYSAMLDKLSRINF